jgi:hypothetical protein
MTPELFFFLLLILVFVFFDSGSYSPDYFCFLSFFFFSFLFFFVLCLLLIMIITKCGAFEGGASGREKPTRFCGSGTCHPRRGLPKVRNRVEVG